MNAGIPDLMIKQKELKEKHEQLKQHINQSHSLTVSDIGPVKSKVERIEVALKKGLSGGKWDVT